MSGPATFSYEEAHQNRISPQWGHPILTLGIHLLALSEAARGRGGSILRWSELRTAINRALAAIPPDDDRVLDELDRLVRVAQELVAGAGMAKSPIVLPDPLDQMVLHAYHWLEEAESLRPEVQEDTRPLFDRLEVLDGSVGTAPGQPPTRATTEGELQQAISEIVDVMRKALPVLTGRWFPCADFWSR